MCLSMAGMHKPVSCLRKYGSSFFQMILLLTGGQFHISKSFDASIQLSTLIILSLPNYEYHHVWHFMLVLYTNVLCLQVQRAWFVKYPRGEIVFSYFFQRFVFTKCLVLMFGFMSHKTPPAFEKSLQTQIPFIL